MVFQGKDGVTNPGLTVQLRIIRQSTDVLGAVFIGLSTSLVEWNSAHTLVRLILDRKPRWLVQFCQIIPHKRVVIIDCDIKSKSEAIALFISHRLLERWQQSCLNRTF